MILGYGLNLVLCGWKGIGFGTMSLYEALDDDDSSIWQSNGSGGFDGFREVESLLVSGEWVKLIDCVEGEF